MHKRKHFESVFLTFLTLACLAGSGVASHLSCNGTSATPHAATV
jgi:hypothetical protein